VTGTGAAAFLDRLSSNKLPQADGKTALAPLLTPRGQVFGDLTVTRLAADHYLMIGSPTAIVYYQRWFDRHRGADDVTIRDVTADWTGFSLTGPKARDVLAELVSEDISHQAFPFLSARRMTVGLAAAIVIRVSFTGELGYELHVEAQHAHALWHRLMAAGEPIGLQRFGLEALELLRIEKGFLTGAEINGQVTLADLAHERFAKREGPYIGKPMSLREGLADPDRPRLVGLVSEQGEPLVAGAHLVEGGMYRPNEPTQGHVTSSCTGPVSGLPIGLGFLARSRERMGGTIFATDPLRGSHIKVRVTEPCMYDPKGERVRG